MPRLHVIGVGVGDPAYVTVAAIEAIRDTDVFFVLDKGETTSDLVGAREAILDAYAAPGRYEVVAIDDPKRARIDKDSPQYPQEVKRWRDARMARIETAIREHLPEGATGAFLVWGDPSLYDGTLRIIDDLAARGLHLDHDVIPGISSIHALTAKHRTLLNRIAGSVLITTGRRLGKGWPTDADDVIVMLDTDFTASAFAGTALGRELTIYWGAYLGTADELLLAGPLDEVVEQIVQTRDEARARKGWIMDTYLLRRGALL